MLFRFSLYGFLKNQQYYEPFFILALREAKLSFFQIGILIAFRELCINVMEVPSGVVADAWGRRRSMILSFGAYILAFLVFAVGTWYWHFFGAMFLFAMGEAFRTGTHKAIIYDWLARQGRAGEFTKVYGFTRSWSKIGSAVSVIIAAALVYFTENYRYVFWLTIPIYLVGIINLMTYPRDLPTPEDGLRLVARMGRLLARSLRLAALKKELRSLLAETMFYDGAFKVTKDYIQPLLRQTAISMPLLVTLGAERVDKRTAVLVAIVFFALHMISSVSSRTSYRVAKVLGGGDRSAKAIWALTAAEYFALGFCLWRGWLVAALALFVLVFVTHNVWRPIFQGRIQAHADNQVMATVLSIESQSRTLAAIVIAPVVGYAVDRLGLWPVGLVGALLAVAGLMVCRHALGRQPSPETV